MAALAEVATAAPPVVAEQGPVNGPRVPASGRLTPADVPLANVDQRTLDRVLNKLTRPREGSR